MNAASVFHLSADKLLNVWNTAMAAGSSVIPMHMMRISLHHRNVDVHQPDFGRLWAKLRILNRMEEQDLDGSNSAKVLFCGHGVKCGKTGFFCDFYKENLCTQVGTDWKHMLRRSGIKTAVIGKVAEKIRQK